MRYITRLLTAPMPSCAREIHVLCLKGILVACLGMGGFCCLKVVVAGCWLCRFDPHPTIWLPWGFLVAYKVLLGLLNPFELVRRLWEHS